MAALAEERPRGLLRLRLKATADVERILGKLHCGRALPRDLAALRQTLQTVPEIAQALHRPAHEVMFWVMGLRKYGFVAEIKEATDEGYYRYQAVEREGA